MINRLKRKFTILATVLMFALMTVLVGIMNVINYSVVVKDSDSTVNILMHADDRTAPDGDAPAKPNTDGTVTPGGAAPEIPAGETPSTPYDDSSVAPETGGIIKPDQNTNTDGSTNEGKGNPDFKTPDGMSPEVPYEARFFTVTVNADGTIESTDLSKILTVDETTVNDYVDKALASNSDKGFVGQFRYAKRTDEKGTTILFLDCGRKLDSFKSFLWTSVGVGFGGCVLLFIVFLLLSGKIVKPIAESYEKQKRFISDAGHEMKTPLTIINANLDLIEGENDESDELAEIRRQTKRMSELTNNLVYLSKMEEAEHKINKIEMPLSDTVSEAINPFRNLAAAKGLKFISDIKPNLEISGSPDAIRHLASILAENAVKYADKGGEIIVTLTANKKSAVLSVYNTTASAIKKSDLPHVFDRFYRTDDSRNSETGGHGIGLSIAKAITEAHGGSIKAETKCGKDFCVTATLPLK